MPSIEFSPIYHPIFEALAYFVGFRVFLWGRKKQQGVVLDTQLWIWLAVGAILGAALGSKVVFWLQDPITLGENWRELRTWMAGKTVVGGFLGGVLGVEITKKLHGISQATGDVFVGPMTLGLILGRLGCFFAGLSDRTYGLPSAMPWAIDFGDGIPRHPTQLYEIIFLLGFWFALKGLGDLPRQGDRFKLWMMGYLVFRLLVEWIKPMPFAYAGVVSGIQLACLAGLGYYLPHSWRILRVRKPHP